MRRVLLVALACALVAGLATTASAESWWSRASSFRTVNHLYVDGAEGNDDIESPCDIEVPCATIQAAIDRIPMYMGEDVVVHVVEGVYEGGVLVADRFSPNRSRITIRGEPAAIIWGTSDHTTGLKIWRTPGVALENLEIGGFADYGLVLAYSAPVRMDSVKVLMNGSDGIYVSHSAVQISRSTIEANRGNGLSCDSGWVDVREFSSLDNIQVGILAAKCHVAFDGSAVVHGNKRGLVSMLGAHIDLGMRSDVTVQNDEVDLHADCLGLITGYMHACIGACACVEKDNGICSAGTEAGLGPRQRPRIFDRRE